MVDSKRFSGNSKRFSVNSKAVLGTKVNSKVILGESKGDYR